ncbi:MAG: S-methyl-5'-thioadenosine phosphorylase [Candidatus Undinarchaeales archaeon]
MVKAKIGIIGGTGVYDSEMLKNPEEIEMKTPYGEPSDNITVGNFKGKGVAFLPRHGKEHTIPPHKINGRANIYALKELGVERIFAPQAVGSLREEMKPGDIVFPDQFINRTWERLETFYDEGQVCHISMADPFCIELRDILIENTKDKDFDFHSGGTYVCIQGPRFSTRAESNMYRQWGADIIGMTLVPEVVLAREAEICYSSIATITDYDCWKETAVSLDEVVNTMKKNQEKVKDILKTIIPEIPEERGNCECGNALKGALL